MKAKIGNISGTRPININHQRLNRMSGYTKGKAKQ